VQSPASVPGSSGHCIDLWGVAIRCSHPTTRQSNCCRDKISQRPQLRSRRLLCVICGICGSSFFSQKPGNVHRFRRFAQIENRRPHRVPLPMTGPCPTPNYGTHEASRGIAFRCSHPAKKDAR
jgi:hypothetical protein